MPTSETSDSNARFDVRAEEPSYRPLASIVVPPVTTPVLEAYNSSCIDIIEAQGEITADEWKEHLQVHFHSPLLGA